MADPSAPDLFARYLDAKERGEAGDFETLCRQHPEQAEELRRYHDASRRLEREARDRTVVTAQGGERSRWTEYLEKLARLGPPAARYARGDELNAGGMGAIHHVTDPLLERKLVVKLMHGDEGSRSGARGGRPRTDDRTLGRFLEEAKITARLEHPYIVPVHDIGLDDAGRVYFAMKHVRGEDLRGIFDRIHAGHPEWSMTRGIQVMLKVCEAMAYAHAKGVIHRDLKPGNVMVGAYGEVFVMDWGLARILGEDDAKGRHDRDDVAGSVMQSSRRAKHAESGAASDSPLLTMDGEVMGTPAYMPLEQAEGNLAAIGPRADIYAVGAMLYHLLAGAMPYVEASESVSQRVILQRVMMRPPRSLHELAPAAPAELIAIVEKAMARDAKDRYPDMNALAADLQAYLDVKVVTAYATGAIAELKKWVQRNPALATAAGVLVLVLAGATMIVTRQKRDVDAKNVALGKANAEITTQKAAVESQRQLAEEKIREFDQLAGKVYLERALAREKHLYPAWPGRIEAMERWLAEDAQRLVDLTPKLEQTLTDLRARALPESVDDDVGDRAAHPKAAELEALRAERTWRLRRAAARAAATPPGNPPPLPVAFAPKRAIELNAFAWQRVDPDLTKRSFGEETLALAAANAAVAKIEAGDHSAALSSTLDTLAWAYLANGFDAEARAASARALENAAPEKEAEYRSRAESIEKAIAELSGEAGASRLTVLESKIAALEADVNSSRSFTFALESETFLYAALSDLAASIAAFESGAKADVERRLAWARRIGDLTLRHPNARVTWEVARASIAKADDVVASKLYARSPGGAPDLRPQSGLVPIGMNPVTRLWEFYDLRSACDLAAGQDPATLEIPRHRDDGSIAVSEGTGIVFVLLPGGTFMQGAQPTDASAPNYDPRADTDEWPQEVTLAPFFLARHELTRAQWFRLSDGAEPSTNPRGIAFPGDEPIGWTHPVESVEWTMCRDLFARHGLTLATEARWEYGARAGTTTAWWTGDEPSSLASAANVLDLRAMKAYPNWGLQIGDFDDGYIGSCPVGSLRANPFGLHDTVGNLWEWCFDVHQEVYGPPREGDGLRSDDGSTPGYRIYRGCSYITGASIGRSAERNKMASITRAASVGVRAARDMMAAGD